MKAVILVGGEGTRLRPLTYRTPKCMVPVLNAPFLEHVICWLRGHGLTTIVLALGHLSPRVQEYLGDGRALDIELVYSVENAPMGTAGPVKMAEKHLDDTFVVLNGDIFTDLDVTAMVAYHREKRALATIALTPVADPTAYGLIETTAEGRVTRFLEKPTPDQVTTNMINAGTYVLEPDVLGDIPSGTKFMFERELFPMLLAQGKPVYAYPSSAYWIDVGTPQKYRQLNADLLTHRVSPDCARVPPGTGERISIHPAAQISGAVLLGERCIIDPRASLVGPTVVGSDCSIGEGSSVIASIIWRGTRIGARVTVRGSIVADGCHIDDGSSVTDSVLGAGVTVSGRVTLKAGSRVDPDTVVS